MLYDYEILSELIDSDHEIPTPIQALNEVNLYPYILYIDINCAT